VTAAAVACALVAAACYALSTAAQYRAARQETRYRTLDPRLLLRLLHRPLWLAGWVPDLAATGLQAAALRFGPIALVQPLLASGLFLAILLEAALSRRRPRRRDLLAVALSATGLAGFLAAAQPGEGVTDPTRSAWLAVLAGCAGVVAGCLGAARFLAGSARAALVGVAAGVLYGLTAALLKTVITALTTAPVRVFTTWQVYALILAGLAGLVLNQDAFQPGPLAAPLTALTLADPVASVAIGVTAFHERLATGTGWRSIQIAAALTMATGVWLASRRTPVSAGG
jgi:drug/metabolite transporter (DMT)-like permease